MGGNAGWEIEEVRWDTTALVFLFGIVFAVIAETIPCRMIDPSVCIPEPHRFGRSLAVVGDVNADGQDDWVVGYRVIDPSDATHPLDQICLLFPDESGSVKSCHTIGRDSGDLDRDWTFGEQFGSALAPLGDLNADGIPDLAVGIPGGCGRDRRFTGTLLILFPRPDGSVEASSILDGSQFPLEEGDGFGKSIVQIPDFDGDGFSDLAISSPESLRSTSSARGSVYLVSMHPDGTLKTSRRIQANQPAFQNHLSGNHVFGSSLGCVGDLDGNGMGDLAIGCPRNGTQMGQPELHTPGAISSGVVFITRLDSEGEILSVHSIRSPCTLESYSGKGMDQDWFGESLLGMGGQSPDAPAQLVVANPFPEYSEVLSTDTGGVLWRFNLGEEGCVLSTRKTSAPHRFLAEENKARLAFGSAMTQWKNPEGSGESLLLVGIPGYSKNGIQGGGVAILDLENHAPAVPGPILVACLLFPMRSIQFWTGMNAATLELAKLIGRISGTVPSWKALQL